MSPEALLMTLVRPHDAQLMTNNTRPLLMVVDDELPVLRVVERMAAKAGYDVVTCAGGVDAMRELLRRPADLAMVDLRMPDVNGLDLLRQIRATVSGCEVILMTGHAAVDSAVEAIKLGAREYLTKPFDHDRLRQLLVDIRLEIERRAQVTALESEVARQVEFCGMVGRSPAMQEVFSLITRLAPHAKVVLIAGETGTGKELAARAFHQAGPRRHKPFVTINCSAVVDTLFESELFGHVRGAFTGAVDSKAGVFELAHGGTLFLDEVGELPVSVQAKLLRALENGEVQRVGSLQPKRVDVTVVAASNRDLRAEVAAGRFRGDLFYRLNVCEVLLPPLRERREDIPYLTSAFVRDAAQRTRKPITGLTPSAERKLFNAQWEGNVRELKNVIERACMLADATVISERELGGAFGPARIAAPEPSLAPARPPRSIAPGEADGITRPLDQIERDHIVDVLRQVRGNRMAAAKLLGISRRALYRRLERHRLIDEVPSSGASRRIS
ncbi:MAG TPA: sigma-54 dependent transcriptional regulator [Vicinamibacterales bacterium]|nr:sigma-54 dependent transcriptional regulator [Vicinamibacterales bacterium]